MSVVGPQSGRGFSCRCRAGHSQIEDIRLLMNNKFNIRNMSVIAHVDHGAGPIGAEGGEKWYRACSVLLLVGACLGLGALL